MLKTFENKLLNNLGKLSPDQLKRVIEETCEERELLHNILNSILEAVMVTDRKGRLLYLNRFGEKILNSKLKEAGTQVLKDLVKDPELKSMITRVIDEEEKVDGEELFVKQPYELILSGNAFTITDKGRINGYVFLFVDITEHKNISLKKHHDESIASLAALTAGVAHEIKNPLGSLDLHLQLINRLLRDSDFKNKDEFMELTSIIGDEIKRLNRIVNDFLFSVRPIKPVLKPEKLNEVMDEVVKFLEPEFNKNGIEIATDFDVKVPLLNLDKNLLKQAVINVLKNAAQAISDDAKDGLIRVTTTLKGEKIILEIKDNGCGMSKKTLNNIFDPYYTTKDMGTGLGLTIVYRIIQEHGGEIIISSEEGKGTVFRIELPENQSDVKLIGSGQDEK